jgi:hypothetical protein
LADLPGLSWHFLIVDDSCEGRMEAVERGFKLARQGCPDPLGTLEVIPLLREGRPQRKQDRKGLAIRRGFVHLLLNAEQRWSALAYINLNLKVHMNQLPSVLLPVLLEQSDVSIGTRCPGEGGAVLGAGPTGRLKSIVYNILASGCFPILKSFADTNAPVKIGNSAAIRHLIQVAQVEDVSFDTEWLLAFVEGRFPVQKIGIVWQQIHGSQPPWDAIPKVLLSLIRQRRRWLGRQFRRRSNHESRQRA